MLQRHALIVLAGSLLLSGCQGIYDDTKGWANRLETSILEPAAAEAAPAASPSPVSAAVETATPPAATAATAALQRAALTRLPRPDGTPVLIDPADKRPQDGLLLDSLPSPAEPAPLKDASTDGGGSSAPAKAAAETAAADAKLPPLPQPKPETTKVAATEKTPEAAADHALVLHLSSLRSEDAAKREWDDLQRRYPAALGEMQGEIRRTELGGEQGTFYRVLAGPLPSTTAAKEACAAVKARNAKQYCRVLPPKPKS